MKKLVWAGVALAALALSGCSSIDTGRITEKNHTDAWYQTTQTCVSYSKEGYCTMYMPSTVHHPASWSFDIENGEDTGWVYVSEDTWGNYEVGDWYGK